MYIHTTDGYATSIQVTKIGNIDISTADFTLPDNKPFLIKNNSDDEVSVEIKSIENDSFIATTIPAYSWEPVICKAVKANANISNLQYGI